jgi:hypothetical protein
MSENNQPYRQKGEAPMSQHKNTYLTDHATGTDLLRYEDFQSALYDILTQAETPLKVGVFGPWDSGKWGSPVLPNGMSGARGNGRSSQTFLCLERLNILIHRQHIWFVNKFLILT